MRTTLAQPRPDPPDIRELDKRGLRGDWNRDPDPGEFWPEPEEPEDDDETGGGRSRPHGGGANSGDHRGEQVTSARQALDAIKSLNNV
ncbi:hypothetical protein OHB41_49680 [Streptomyces sp. NBC_01571]|uniref:hypothetical protein n=1 Tax=Streptomyces sp. NBC_01571 TaxID=2975883 RepID=UPI002258224A|nr:hypothetical protein [Streptomyces sp. NBC_01571]MCX4581034.1 hypothetical protein [Streptomyces sp. NBC_01571]